MNDWQTILAIDFDRWAVACYRANFPGVDVRHGPVADYIDGLPACDVLLGGPPCQPWSNAGEGKGEDDERDCIPDYVSAIRRVRPRMFLMENVPGLLNQRHARYIGGVYTEMESAGYAVEARELDAVNFGVPQFRNRVWFWGIRSDVAAAGARHCWPKPTHLWPPLMKDPDLFGCPGRLHFEDGVTVGQALGRENFHLYRMRGAGLLERSGPRRTHPSNEPCPTIGTTFALGGGGGLQIIDYDHGVARDDEPSPTIKAGGNRDSTGRQGGGCPPMLASRRRRMTPDECARIQSMPYDFVWPDKISKTERYRVIGNGWACGMAKVMSAALKAVDPKSVTVVDLFCGGGLGAVGWHGQAWRYEPTESAVA